MEGSLFGFPIVPSDDLPEFDGDDLVLGPPELIGVGMDPQLKRVADAKLAILGNVQRFAPEDVEVIVDDLDPLAYEILESGAYLLVDALARIPKGDGGE